MYAFITENIRKSPHFKLNYIPSHVHISVSVYVYTGPLKTEADSLIQSIQLKSLHIEEEIINQYTL